MGTTTTAVFSAISRGINLKQHISRNLSGRHQRLQLHVHSCTNRDSAGLVKLPDT